MIKKTTGYWRVDKLHTIILYMADFNFSIKSLEQMLYGRQNNKTRSPQNNMAVEEVCTVALSSKCLISASPLTLFNRDGFLQ